MNSPDAQLQLHQAWQDSGLTLEELLSRSKLKLTVVSLSRKLRGKQVLNTEECAVLATVLDTTVTIGGGKKAGGKRRAKAA